jgi:hypothetical protein
MREAMTVPKRTPGHARKKPAAKKPARKPAAGATIDNLLEQVRTRGQALSVDIKDLLARIG